MLLGSSARRSHAGGPGRSCRAGGDRHVHVPRGDFILPRRRATSLVQYWRWERDIGEPIELNPTDFAYWLNSKTTASRVWLPLSVPAWIELVLKQNPSTSCSLCSCARLPSRVFTLYSRRTYSSAKRDSCSKAEEEPRGWAMRWLPGTAHTSNES